MIDICERGVWAIHSAPFLFMFRDLIIIFYEERKVI